MIRSWAGAFLLLGIVGCGAPEVFVPASDRTEGLPDDVDGLIAVADGVADQDAPSPREVDRAVAALDKALDQGPEDSFEILWRMARAQHRMAHVLEAKGQKLQYAEAGRRSAEQAVERQPDRIEGHYYLALNMARVAEASGDAGILKELVPIARKAAEIDRTFDEAGPLRLLGKVLMVAPEWPANVGDREEAVNLLKEAVSVAPTALNRLFLGEAFYHAEDYGRAERQLRRALKDAEAEGLEERWIDEAEDYLRRMGATP